MIAIPQRCRPKRTLVISLAALLILSACAELGLENPIDRTGTEVDRTVTEADRNGTATATPRPSPRVDLGVTIDGIYAFTVCIFTHEIFRMSIAFKPL